MPKFPRLIQWLKQCALIGLFIFAPLITLWVKRHQIPGYTLPETSTVQAADWFANNIKSTVLDENGQPEKVIQAEKLLHYDREHATHMTHPIFVLYKNQPNNTTPPWQLQATTGIAYHGVHIEDIDKVALTHQVRLHRDASDTSDETTMTTEQLDIFPEKQLATSEVLVTFTQPSHTMTGQGMIAHLDTGTVELLHHVRGQHDNR